MSPAGDAGDGGFGALRRGGSGSAGPQCTARSCGGAVRDAGASAVECGRLHGDIAVRGLEVLALLWLDRCIVTADALHCRPDSAWAILATGADYALALRSNCSKCSLRRALIARGEADGAAGAMPSSSASQPISDSPAPEGEGGICSTPLPSPAPRSSCAASGAWAGSPRGNRNCAAPPRPNNPGDSPRPGTSRRHIRSW